MSALSSLGALDPQSAAKLISAAADVALVVDREGVIRDVSFGNESLSAEMNSKWQGRSWADTVTQDSRAKVELLLREAAGTVPGRWRQVNYTAVRGADIPVVYNAVQVGSDGRIVAVGRDLRAVSLLQQRLIEAEQSLESDFNRLRQAETRYRLLFHISAEAVLVVDAGSQRIIEANPACAQLLGEASGRLLGRSFLAIFDLRSAKLIQGLLTTTLNTGVGEDVVARAEDGSRELQVTASLFRQADSSCFLVRLAAVSAAGHATALPRLPSRLLEVLERSPDGLVVTDFNGQILSANRAFLDLTQLATEEQLRGESLDRWLGRPGVDLNVLLANLRQLGSVRLFATTLRGEYGTSREVEISGVAVPQGDPPCLGFTVRDVARRSQSTETRSLRELPRSVEQLTELVGRVSLKELVRETTDVIERLCIEAALDLTHGNRVSAAEMLGLSRQSLYVKLRRFGLVEGSSGQAPE